MLTGQVPFDGENSVSIALKHINENPKPPIERNAKVTPALNDVIMRALSKDLNRRYTTAREMSDHLRRALKKPCVQVEDVARVRLAARRASQEKKPRGTSVHE